MWLYWCLLSTIISGFTAIALKKCSNNDSKQIAIAGLLLFHLLMIIVSLIANDKIGKAISIGYNILKYPTSILIIFFFIKLLYTMAPDTTIKSKDTTTGAFVTTIGWIISTEVYSFYVSSFAKYNLLYGSVANLIILFLWIYLLSYIFVLGMALNASSHVDAIDKNND